MTLDHSVVDVNNASMCSILSFLTRFKWRETTIGYIERSSRLALTTYTKNLPSRTLFVPDWISVTRLAPKAENTVDTPRGMAQENPC